MDLLERLRDNLSTLRVAAETRHALSRLDRRQLADIGVEPDGLWSAAWAAAQADVLASSAQAQSQARGERTILARHGVGLRRI
jgi:hypothetical protein